MNIDTDTLTTLAIAWKLGIRLVLTLLFAIGLYFVSAMEGAVFSLQSYPIESSDIRLKWLVHRLKRSDVLQAFFITVRALFIALFVITLHYYFDELKISSPIRRYFIEGIFIGGGIVLALQLMPSAGTMWKPGRTVNLSPILMALYYLLFPASILVKAILDLLLKILGAEGLSSVATQREMCYAVPTDDSLSLNPQEKQMIRQIVNFAETKVREIMVPRVDIISAPVSSTPEEIIDLTRKYGHSRIPIYEEKIDNIVGILHIKDLLIALGNSDKYIDLRKICRKPLFVPEAKLVSSLMSEFRKNRVHIAIVVDEYGGVSGLITLEDILEEIVGEIQDEHDRDEVPPIAKIGDNVWRVQAVVTVDDVNDALGLELPEEPADTIGGLVYYLSGRIPCEGEILKPIGNVQIVVEKVENQRIKAVRLIVDKEPEK